MDKTPRIVAVATMKGGSGKTTVAMCLAARWMQSNVQTALIDADPQRSALRWAGSGDDLLKLRMAVISDPDGADADSVISSLLEEGYQRIVIDTPGFRAPSAEAIFAHAQLVLIPIKPSPLDFEVAADTLELLHQLAAGAGRKLLARFVLSQTTPRSVVARHMRVELKQAGYPLLHSSLANRVLHTEAPFSGTTPSLISPSSTAAREVEALRAEVDTLLKTLGN